MAEESARQTEMDKADIESRIRALERQALEAQPPATVPFRQPGELQVAAKRRRDQEASLGGLLWLLVGLVLIGSGLLQYAGRLVVWSGFGLGGGQLSIGLILIPFILGVALAVTGGRVVRFVGVVIIAASIVAIFGSSLRNLGIFFRPTPLLDVMAMLALIGVGIGMVVRGVRRL